MTAKAERSSTVVGFELTAGVGGLVCDDPNAVGDVHGQRAKSNVAAPGLLEDVEEALRVRFGRKQTEMQRRGGARVNGTVVGNTLAAAAA